MDFHEMCIKTVSDTFGKMFILVMNGLNHPRSSLLSNCPLALSGQKPTKTKPTNTLDLLPTWKHLEDLRGSAFTSLFIKNRLF